MREKFVNIFKRNSTLKVISVIAAIIIWFIVLSDDNPKWKEPCRHLILSGRDKLLLIPEIML